MKYLLYAYLLLIWACSTVTIPQYTTVNKLSKLKTGMTKKQVTTVLGIYPYDAYGMQKDGCEVYEYKYKRIFRETSSKTLETIDGLTNGGKRYDKEDNAFLIFNGGELRTIYTNTGLGDYNSLILSLSDMKEQCGNTGDDIFVYGCMDKNSINFNPNANIDDGKCEYCECGYILNPERETNPNCPPCIPSKEEKGPCAKERILNKLIEQGKGDLNIDIKIDEKGLGCDDDTPSNPLNKLPKKRIK